LATQATLADVATLAGVSLATASRALNPAKGQSVGAELRARVRAAAAELSYAPNAHAQAMRSPAATSIGLVVHDIADPVAAAIASGVLAAAGAKGLIVTIGATGSDPEAEVRLIESLRRQRARAIILAGSRFTDSPAQRWLIEEVAAIQASGGRVVTIGQDQLATDAVVIENASGAAALAHSLWDLGYRRYALLTGPEYLVTSEHRVAGFREALSQHGYQIPEENVLASQLSRDGGYTAMRELLEEQLVVDCVFAVDDTMAMGAVAAARDSGHRVPGDIAVAGFGDIAALRDVVPGLTTVRLPLAEMGRAAFEVAFAVRPGPQVRRVAGTVVLRASTPRQPG
jgi:LacI family transcriptional regulator